MRAAANLLALCLLALTSPAARLQWLKPLNGVQYDETSTESDQAKPLCEYPPRILVNSANCEIYDSGFNNGPNKVSVASGTEVNVECRGADADQLTLSRNGKKIIPSEQWDYTISLKQKLDLQSSQYIFKCTDIDTTCERSVNIFTTPRLEVISPNVKTCFLHNGNCSLSYYVQYGNSVTVLCSGAAANRLVVTKNGKTLPTERTNGTTIESFEMRPDLQISEYACSDVDTTLSTNMNIKVVPNIYFQSQNETITPYNVHADCDRRTFFQEYYFQYSGSIELFCSGPRAVKFMHPTSTNEILPRKNFNETTIFTNISKSGIAEDITCADSEFTDYVQRVKVILFNRMEVVSPRARLVGIECGVPMYTIPYGQPLEIVCSGADASRLTISELRGAQCITNSVVQAVNISAIKYIINNSVCDDFMPLICSDPESYDGDFELSQIQVAVLPAVTNFRCVSYNLQFVNCTWTRISYSANNTLYYVADGILTQICVLPRTSMLSKFCAWEYEYDYGFKQATVLTFLIQSCSYDACYNETFQFDHLSIVKLAPPEKLKVLRTTSRGAVIWWSFRLTSNAEFNILTDYYGGVDHVVQYWYPGIDPREDNSSLVTCEYDAYSYCEIELNLPCPGQLYEVRISHKLNVASEEFMSAPGSVAFYTDRESDNAINNDATCSREPIKTKEVMRYIVRELRKEMLPEIPPMKRAVRALQEKLANVHRYIASIKEKDDK